MLIVHFIDNFLLVRPENQQQKQVEVRFHSRSYIGQRDQIDYVSGGATMHFFKNLGNAKMSNYSAPQSEPLWPFM